MYKIMEGSKRILWIDYSKAICIVLMVIGHAGISSVNADFRTFFYYFHIPCLYVVSGYLDKKKNIANLLMSLGIPLVIFSLANYPWYVYNLYHHGDVFDCQSLLIKPLLGLWLHDFNLGHPLCGPFWFVIALMIDKIVIDHLIPDKKPIIEFCVAFVCTLVLLSDVSFLDSKWMFMIKKAMISMPFFVFGRFLNRYSFFTEYMNAQENFKTVSIISVGGGYFAVVVI